MEDDTYVTIKEAAEMIGVTPLTLRNWDRSGKFPARRHPMNNYRVYKLSDIENLLGGIENADPKNLSRAPVENVKKLEIKHLEDE